MQILILNLTRAQNAGLQGAWHWGCALDQLRNMRVFILPLLNKATDSDIRIVHWVKKRVVGAAPGSNNNMSIVSKIIRVLWAKKKGPNI